MRATTAPASVPSAGGMAQNSATRARRRPAAWIVPGLLLFSALPLSFGILRLLGLAGLADLMPPTPAPPIALVLHIVGALAFALLGALQFSTALRRAAPGWHRMAGRVALSGAGLVAISALWLSASYATPSPGGLLLAGIRIAVASVLALSIGLGIAAAIRRDFTRPRAWMIRAYALGLGSATQMLVLMIAEMATGGPPTDLNRALLMALAWGINLAIAEYAIRRRPSAR